MRKALLPLVICLIAAGSSEAGNSPGIENLKSAMAYGSMAELNKLDASIEKKLLIRLYKVPLLNGNCFVETHGTCQNKYFISVSTYDEQPEVNVFEMKAAGEVSRIQWIKTKGIDSAEIELIVNKYTKKALTNNSALKNNQLKVNLKLDVNKIIETTLP